MNKNILAALAATALMGASASATPFVFKGDGNTVTPLGVAGVDFQENCASTGDFCSIDSDAGLLFSHEGVALQVLAYAGGDGTGAANLGQTTRLIQDINPSDSGLGAFSENNSSDDQTQFDAGEAIEFLFDDVYNVTNVEFNAGGDIDCTANGGAGGGEGPCGSYLLEIFDLSDMLLSAMIVDMTNADFTDFGIGARFVLTALTSGAGFTIAQLTVSEVPVPGGVLLLISGIAGLSFASRRKKDA